MTESRTAASGSQPSAARVTVMVAVPLAPELATTIGSVDPRVAVLYEPKLLPPVRYPNDHAGVDGFTRTPEGDQRWRAMWERSEVLFGIPGDSPQGLRTVVRGNPCLRWVQGTAAGTGEQVKAAGLTAEELARVAITSSSGVHVGPLAEFGLLGLLAFTKNLPRLRADRHAHHWDHYPVAELHGGTLLILGLGKIGSEVARLAKAFGMRTIGVNRRGASESAHVDEVHRLPALHELLPRADAVVISLPLTDETRGVIDTAAIERMKRGVILVNIGRGGVVAEAALVQGLRGGKIAGAALDVFETEPLPSDSPLWELENVLLSPHTAALSVHENERIVALFSENLRRYLRGEQLLSRVDTKLFF